MKTLVRFILLVLIPAFTAVSQYRIPTVDSWEYVVDGAIIDSSNVGLSFAIGGGVSSKTYGETVNMGGSEYFTQTTISKDFLKQFVLLDTLVLILEFKTGVNLSEFWIGFAIQGSFGYSAESAGKIDLDSSKWQRVSLSMARIKRELKAKDFYRLYLIPQPARFDSGYVGGEIILRSLYGVDSLNNITVYDDFTGSTGVSEQKQIPKGFVLEQNYPNPFNPSTTIRFSVPQQEQVSLTVYNLIGQEVITLVNEEKQKGSYEVKFDASNLPSGTYFYRLRTGSFVETQKMLLLK